NNQAPARRSGGINATFIGAVFLGICILIAGINIGGSVRKLNKTIEEKTFASTNTMNAPSELTMGQKKYLTVEEAADYLNITKERVLNLITSGELAECVKTDTTDTSYSISVDVLDKWFDGEAYENKLKSNASGGDENDES
ncbi:MAG: helix-turn-helix domain-containing protein, partial [Oscillospiraceae bacterium]|nr:helix-turn-helix domain-containing protein [Oscillospiraceae bacterium]